jgi:lipopolysaccharide/colanic/teichoic acid biosynthesis glycosyltransferase
VALRLPLAVIALSVIALAVIALSVRLTSAGAALYWRQRVGSHGV